MSPERHAKLREVLEAAFQLTESERAAYLESACAGDSSLRNRVDELLATGDETILLEEPVWLPGESATMECPKCWRCYDSPLISCPRDNTILQVAFHGPRLIDGKYLAEQHLGHGGMGAVYLVTHVGLEKRFALKLILQQGVESPSYRENFEREARALGRLNHPNIVAVTDYGIDSRGNGLPYLVMEHLEGKALNQILKLRGALPVDEAIHLLRIAAEGIDAAHASQIVHGDLKPSNLFVPETGDPARPSLKIVDFGLARLTTPAPDTDAAPRHRKGDMRGTPAYMAPELLAGAEATPSSDRFALGVLVYEVLTGRLPFGRTLAEIVTNIKKPPAPPSSINAKLPPEIDAPVLALLDRVPEQRPPSATAAISAIAEAALRSEQRKWRASQWPRRLAFAAAMALIAVPISAALTKVRLARVLEDRIADRRFAMLPSKAPDPSLMLLSIDDATLEADQRPLAERAGDFATMVDTVFHSGAKVVAIDLTLPGLWSHSQEFAKSVALHADHLVLALFSSPSGQVIGAECLNPLTAYVLGAQKYANLFGLVNLEEGEDRVIRRAHAAFIDKAGHSRESFAGRVVEAAFPGREKKLPAGDIWIDYSARLRDLPSISWKDVPARLAATPGLFRDKIVILGETYAGSGDEHRVPGLASGTLVAGEYVQALIANTILAGNPIRDVRLMPCLITAGVLCFVLVACMLCFPHRYGLSFGGFLILLAVYPIMAFSIFQSSRVMLPVLGPELAILLSLIGALSLKASLSKYPTIQT